MPDIASPSDSDVIAACATAPGLGGVALIRMSGSGVYAIADQLTALKTPPSKRRAGTFVYANLLNAQNETLDDALLLFFRAPHSYTGEDVIELCVHGSRVIVTAVLERLWQLGARPAGPGEFTRRAFVNGQLDLTQAEAVADLIAAQSPRAERAARANLQGALGRQLTPLYEEVLACSSHVEHVLDFDEGELPEPLLNDLSARIQKLSGALQHLLQSWHEGRLLREGALVVIAGKPNAGKSSLLNLLLGCNRAIVSHEPGTTRDTIEETFLLSGIPLRLMDTAGLRDAPGIVEQEGVARARAMLEQADAVLYLIAADDPEPPPPNVLAIQTKSDLGCPCCASLPSISVKTNPDTARETVCSLLRQALQLSEAETSVRQAAELFARGAWGLVPAAQQLRMAAEAIGRLLGKTYSDDLLDHVFSTFCVGK